MKFLFIVNNFPSMPLFVKTAEQIICLGHEVIVVTDSLHTLNHFDLANKFKNIYIFSEYFEKNKQVEVNTDLVDYWGVHADYDRGEYFGFKYNINWKSAAEKLSSFYKSIYEEHSINCVFYETISNGLAYYADKVGETYGVKYIGLTSSRLPNMACFAKNDFELKTKLKRSHKAKNDICDSDLSFSNDYILNIIDTTPDYMKSNGLDEVKLNKTVFKKRKIKNLLSIVKNSLNRDTEYNFQIGYPIKFSLCNNLRQFKRYFKSKWLRRKQVQELPINLKYYLYPLHYHPEASTSLYAKEYEEIQVIKNIAFSLKTGEFLVVKDHISAHALEQKSFYMDIMTLPNVIFTSPDMNAKLLAKNALGIFTLTSTVGYEALLLNKPVIVFGDVFYDEHPLVFNCNGFKDLGQAFTFIENNQLSDYEQYNIEFITAYKNVCFQITLDMNKSNEELQKDAVLLTHHLIEMN